jgi:SAM-dependent methyltransferase/tetratricopeptide (TPR) repeat protein
MFRGASSSCKPKTGIGSYHMASRTSSNTRKVNWSERGSAAIDAGDLTTAELCFRQAMRTDPRNGRHHFHLAIVLEARAQFGGAAQHYTQALRLNPMEADAARRLSSLIGRQPLPGNVELDPVGLKAALRHETASSWLVTRLALRHLASKGALRQALDTGKREGWPNSARALCVARTAELLKDELFLEVLRTNIVGDGEVEHLLTAIRRALLLEVPPQRFEDRDLLRFAIALMHQCRANEYVWWVSEAEEARIASEADLTEELLEGDITAGRKFLLVSLYKSFGATLGAELDPHAFAKVRPRALREVVQVHLAEDCDLRDRAARIPKLGVISDGISRKVALQYEHNPYPRWTSLRAPMPGEARKRLSTFFKPRQLSFMDQPYNVLIAGCGTGHQAVLAALDSPNARVTAVDLSASALAYASRMAERYGTKDIEFAQADIQQLPTLGAQFWSRFQIIECVGVLHHMADPFGGWRTLLDCLAPGGLMLIGLYSAVARRDVAALRDDPAYPGPGCNDAALRTFRRDLMTRPEGELGASLKLGLDFYSISEFRDLACHVSERCVTLREVKEFLDLNSLVFRGFRFHGPELDQFHEHYPDEPWPGRLDLWEEFEQANPQTFAAMYLLWCERA